MLGLFFPVAIFAQTNNEQICSPVGYSVFTINGIFTNKKSQHYFESFRIIGSKNYQRSF